MTSLQQKYETCKETEKPDPYKEEGEQNLFERAQMSELKTSKQYKVIYKKVFLPTLIFQLLSLQAITVISYIFFQKCSKGMQNYLCVHNTFLIGEVSKIV